MSSNVMCPKRCLCLVLRDQYIYLACFVLLLLFLITMKFWKIPPASYSAGMCSWKVYFYLYKLYNFNFFFYIHHHHHQTHSQ